MTMKSLLIGCICLLASISVWAEETNIKFVKEDMGEFDIRSVFIDPTATQDNNIINIYSAMTLENVQVTVKDMEGNVVFSDVITIPAGQRYTFTLSEESGNYTIELQYQKKLYHGCFMI